MAGESERLELIASVRNLTSGPIKDIQRSMRAMAAEGAQFHKLGVVQSKSHTEALLQLRREVTNLAERMKSGSRPRSPVSEFQV
jgi:hypothetical protein